MNSWSVRRLRVDDLFGMDGQPGRFDSGPIPCVLYPSAKHGRDSSMTRVDVQPGQRIQVKGCYSEVMMHFGLAGEKIEISLEPSRYMNGNLDPSGRMVGQVWVDGKPFSFPVTTGEAGFYRDETGYYTYTD